MSARPSLADPVRRRPEPVPDEVLRAWSDGLARTLPDFAVRPAEGYSRGIDVYKKEKLAEILGNAFRLFRKHHGRWPDPELPTTNDGHFAHKFVLPVPLPPPADKLDIARYVPPEASHLVRLPERPWEGEGSDLPPDDAVLPGRYFLKLSHGSHMNVLVDWPVSAEERQRIAGLVRQWTARRYGVLWGEWWYGFGTPRLFLEREFQVGPQGLLEMKIFVRHGRPVLWCAIEMAWEEDLSRTRWKKMLYCDGDGRRIDGRQVGSMPYDGPLPASLETALEAAALIGRPFPLIRVDFLDTGDGLPWLGELTIGDMNARRMLDPPLEEAARRLLFF